MLLLTSLIAMSALTACNKESDPASAEYTPSSSVAVTSMTLKGTSNTGVTLDSVFFSIDLDARVIANADSLPKGTDVSRLVPVITFPSSVSAAKITMTGGERGDRESDYRVNPSDSIDFTGRVVLSLTAEDGVTSRSYLLKVNVHTVESDTLAWDRLATSPLPSRLGTPKAQKTVKFAGKALCLIEESDGSYTLASSETPAQGAWSHATPGLPASARIETFTASDKALYMLDASGMLHTSADGLAWTPTGAVWTAITGGYGEVVLGTRADAAGALHTSWPRTADIPEVPVAAGFPVSGQTAFGLFTSKWATRPIGFLTGGRLADGKLSNDTWAFDGTRWAVITETPAPALEGAVLVPYYNLLSSSTSWVKKEYPIWMLLGGTAADGSVNREVWITYDNGANWRKADSHLQLPGTVSVLPGADGVTLDHPMSADLNAGWTFTGPAAAPMRRLPVEISDGKVNWECPYIYIFGGTAPDGSLNTEILRGVMMRLQFTPLI